MIILFSYFSCSNILFKKRSQSVEGKLKGEELRKLVLEVYNLRSVTNAKSEIKKDYFSAPCKATLVELKSKSMALQT